MKTLISKLSILFLLCITVTISSIAQSNNALEFIENKGQWDSQIQFKGVLSNGAFFLRKTGFTVVQHSAEDLSRISEMMHGHPSSKENTPVFEHLTKTGKPVSGDGANDILRSHAYEMDFVGSNSNVQIAPDKAQPGYNNYFIGDDPSKWEGNCRLFQTVTYINIYPNIDVKYYSEAGNLKYEFIVRPGGDPSQIAMKFNGVDKLSIKNNELIIKTSVGEIKELYPYTYQYEGAERKKIDCRYKLDGNIVRFNIKNFSQQSTLIIDPTLIFASFTGSTADNWAYTATYGNDGTFYSGGIVFNTGFPTSPGAYQRSYQAGVGEQNFWNMGIMKFSANGSQRLYATYLGGDKKDQPHSLFADAQGNLVIAGRTTSTNYPAVNKFGVQSGWDIVVTKLNAAGSGLIGSLRIGGTADDGFNTADSHTSGPRDLLNNYGDDARSEVILDASNNIYVTSCTQSKDFFTTANAAQKTFGGVQDAVLIKVDPNCTAVNYSSYLGGSGYDAGFVLSLNPTGGDIYVAGGTTSPDFPGPKTGSYQTAYNGGRSDGFVSVFSNDGATYKQSTFVGTTGTDVVFGIQFDKFSFPYIMGITTGTWPVINAAYSNPNSKQYISKFRKDLSGFQYSTVFGTGSQSPNISPVAFLVDRCENVYVSGWGKDIISKYGLDAITNMPVTPDALKLRPDDSDFYFIVLQRNASKLLYGTFYGQTGGMGEHVDGGTSRFDQNGVIYQAICANCGSGGQGGTKPKWPVTPGAWCCSSGYTPATSSGSGQCNLAALKIAFNFAGVGVGVRAFINSVYDTVGCVPLTVTFRDTVINAQSYEWNFGDGSPDVITDSFEIKHTYNNVGTFSVRLIAVDSNSCNIRDTSYTSIIVRNDIATIDFNPVKLPPCESLTYQFNNTSVASPGKPFKEGTFIWDFGDGTRQVAGTGSVTHPYRAAGTYKVKLILTDTNYCNGPDSLERELRISPLVKAQFETPIAGCAPYKATFKNTSLAGQSFTWNFGDGGSSNAINPTYEYTVPGTYVVKLKAVDPATCNVSDSTERTITVLPKPSAAFSFNPIEPAENTPHFFTNNSSSNAVRFKWLFGDGDSLITTSRSVVEHQYNATGKFNACLVAYNQTGCADTVCLTVQTIVTPKLDVPNAFTPLGPSQASKIFVKGFAVAKMRFAIYNRLGQKLFETADINQGWDGRFKGTVQPMDVYVYTLDIEFTDGTRTTRTGDITLIR